MTDSGSFPRFPYVDSAFHVPRSWGQPPASYHSIEVIDGIMIGELSRWESLGIEDWLAFESTVLQQSHKGDQDETKRSHYTGSTIHD